MQHEIRLGSGVSAHKAVDRTTWMNAALAGIESSDISQFGDLNVGITVNEDDTMFVIGAGEHLLVLKLSDYERNHRQRMTLRLDYAKRHFDDPDIQVEHNTTPEEMEFHVEIALNYAATSIETNLNQRERDRWRPHAESR